MDTPIEGIPKLTDLTHSGEFLALGQTSLWYLALALAFLLFVGGFFLLFFRGRTTETVELRLENGFDTYERLIYQKIAQCSCHSHWVWRGVKCDSGGTRLIPAFVAQYTV